MKNKLLIALTLVMVLSLTFAFVACDSELDVTKIELMDGSFNAEYTVGATVDLSSAKIKVTFSDGTHKEVALTADMLNKAIDTSAAGEATYTITYKGVITTVTIKVVNPKEYEIETFELPTYITNALAVAATEGTEDANFKVANRLYEVGNANAFLVKCVATGYNLNDDEVTINNVKTTCNIAISDTEDGAYTAVADAELKKYVTVEDGYKYFFTEKAAGKFVKLTINLDPDTYIIKSGVIASRTLNFKVVENGYNVYDQDGLSVMNDNTRPELWADIWGCEVVKGKLEPTDKVVQLEADTQALYKYVGNIDWVVLHGNITINADKLPADFFWSTTSTATGFADSAEATIKDKFNVAKAAQNAHSDVIGNEQLEGTLIDGDGNNVYYSIAINNTDDNNNKGLYSTTKVSVSGNYNAITVDKNRTESGRILKVLISKNAGDVKENPNYMQMSQWYLFKMFNRKSADGNWAEPSDDIKFELKNVALTGNGGKTEAVGPQGICMVNTFAREATINNVVANGFYSNVAMDNYFTNSKKPQIVTITDSKMYDTYNAMILTWRGTVDVKNSMLKDTGGPLVLLMDGTTRDIVTDAVNPTVTVDEYTTMEAMSMGTESWYTQLDSSVPQVFALLKSYDTKLQKISGRSFVHAKTVGAETNTYINVLSLFIPEGDTALDAGKDHYWFTGEFVAPNHIADMEDDLIFKARENNEDSEGIARTLAAFNQGTMFFKSGAAYACVWRDLAGNDIIVSIPMLLKRLQAFAATGNKDSTALVFDTTTEEYKKGIDDLKEEWADNSTDMITIWTQVKPGIARSPYLGLVLGSYDAVASQPSVSDK